MERYQMITFQVRRKKNKLIFKYDVHRKTKKGANCLTFPSSPKRNVLVFFNNNTSENQDLYSLTHRTFLTCYYQGDSSGEDYIQ